MTDRIVGPSGSRRRRRFFLFVPLAALAALFLAMGASGGAIGTAAGFEDDDGNLAPQAPINFDWNSFAPTTWAGTAPTRQSTKTFAGWKFLGLEDYQATTADTGFAGGTKQDDNCPTVITAKADNKADLKRAYIASKTAANGHTYLELAWVRIPQNTTSPSAHIAFEFNKGTTACGAASDGLVQRVAGDMLVVYDFEGGSTDTPGITVRRWVASGTCEISNDSAPCWGPATNLTTTGFAEAKVNTFGSVSDGIAPSPPETLGTSEFGEAGIDLTGAGIFPIGTCVSFGKVFAVSRTSGNSGTAQMKDLVGPGNFRLSNCGSITIIKHTDPRGLNQDFSYTTTGGLSPASFTLNDTGNSGGGDSAGNTRTYSDVPAGSYSVTEGADPANFVFDSLTCTATGTGTSATTSGKTASITLAGDGNVTCTYVNKQQLGAIKVTKQRKHAADGPGLHPHAGVSFTVNGVTKQTDSNGVACFDNLPFGTYTVHETVPSGYSVDANDKQVTVDNSATCADATYVGETSSFTNTPLTDITVSVNSQVDGGTSSTITCTNSSNGTVASGSTGANGDGSATGTNLPPDTYTCTVVVDP
jgi:hypothetical protein